MEAFVQLRYSAADLRSLNQCRLYLQVLTLSNITSVDGTSFLQSVLDGVLSSDRASLLKWPRQTRPPAKAWGLWNRALTHFLDRGKLRRPLGHWLPPHHHQRWKWQTGRLFHLLEANDQWERFDPVASRRAGRNTLWYSTSSRCPAPVLFQLIQVDRLHSPTLPDDLFSVRYSEHLQLLPQTPSMPPAESRLHASIDHHYFSLLVGLFHISDSNIQAIAGAVVSRSLHTCCDGSVDKGRGCHAWAFATADGTILCTGAGPDDGQPALMTSYRSELGGITALLYLPSRVQQLEHIDSGRAYLYCDNKGALDKVFSPDLPSGIFPLLEPDYDLLGM